MRFLRRLLARLRTRRFLDRLVRTKGEQLGAIRLSAAASKLRETHEQNFMSTVRASPSVASPRSSRYASSIWTGEFYRQSSEPLVKSLSSRFGFPALTKSSSLPTSPSTNDSTLRLEFSPLMLSPTDEEKSGDSEGCKGDPFEMWDYVHPRFVRQTSLNEWV